MEPAPTRALDAGLIVATVETAERPPMGLGTQPTPARPRHLAARRHLAGSARLDLASPRLPPSRACCHGSSTPVFSKAGRRLRHGCLQFFADQAALSEPPVFEWLCHHSAIN